jgi:hypothetical protein
MPSTQKLLSDSAIGEGVVPLTADNEPVFQAPDLQQTLISNANGYYPDKSRFTVFGRCSDVDNTLRTVWDGPTPQYARPATPQQLRLVSTSAQDSATGTGCRTLVIEYLDHLYIERSEIVTLNGLTPVNTVATNILRINYIRVQTLGVAASQTVGNVSITNLAGDVTYGFMSAGGNSARQGVYTVPAGKNAYISRFDVSSGSTGTHYTRFVLSSTSYDSVSVLIIAETVIHYVNGSIVFQSPVLIPEKSDIRVLAASDSASANVIAAASFSGWIETA